MHFSQLKTQACTQCGEKKPFFPADDGCSTCHESSDLRVFSSSLRLTFRLLAKEHFNIWKQTPLWYDAAKSNAYTHFVGTGTAALQGNWKSEMTLKVDVKCLKCRNVALSHIMDVKPVRSVLTAVITTLLKQYSGLPCWTRRRDVYFRRLKSILSQFLCRTDTGSGRAMAALCWSLKKCAAPRLASIWWPAETAWNGL